MRQRIRFAAVMTAVVVVLAGTALGVAAHWDVLDAFFKGDTSPAQDLVDREVRSVSDKDYTFTVESSVSDGRDAYLIVRVDALNENAAAKLRNDSFVDMDTFNFYPVVTPSAPASGTPADGADPAFSSVGWSVGQIKSRVTDTSQAWQIDIDLPSEGAVSAIRARLGYMDPSCAVEVPLSPAESVTIRLGATGQGAPTMENRSPGLITIGQVTLSPFTCQIDATLENDAANTDPRIFFRMADGSLRTDSQMMDFNSGSRSRDVPGGRITLTQTYQFKEVQDLSAIAGVVFAGREYPLDGGSSKPAEVDGALSPFEIPLMDSLTAEWGGYSIPVRALCDGLGAVYAWDDAGQTATCTYGGVTITLTVDSETALVDGRAMETDPSRIQNGLLAADYRVFQDAWGLRCFAAYNADKSDRAVWVIIP